MRPRWRVQAFLSATVTGTREVAYEPRFFVTSWAAARQVAALEQSFAPGMARIVKERTQPTATTAEGDPT
jgi:hypothetical protein